MSVSALASSLSSLTLPHHFFTFFVFRAMCDEVFDPFHQFRKNCEDVWDAIVDIDDELRRIRGQTLASQEQDAQHLPLGDRLP